MPITGAGTGGVASADAILNKGKAGGQAINPTGVPTFPLNTYDLQLRGTLYVGDGTPTSNTVQAQVLNVFSGDGLGSLPVAASLSVNEQSTDVIAGAGSYVANFQWTGGGSWAVGSAFSSIAAMNFFVSVATAVVVTGDFLAANTGLADCSLFAGSTLNSLYGDYFLISLSSAITCPVYAGARRNMSMGAGTVTECFGYLVDGDNGFSGGTISAAYAFSVRSTWAIMSGVSEWAAYHIPVISDLGFGVPTKIWGFLQQDINDNAYAGKSSFGKNTVPVAIVDIVAGSTTVPPLKLTSGTSLTTAIAGCVEFTTNDLFFTITTGTARKRILMADPTGGLTSGRVPFATTNGRLTDDSDMTFSVDTLTITKIAAHQLTGNLTIADAINIILNATTGTKIGTATSEKLAFHNSTPVIQRAGAAQAAVATTASTNVTPFGYTTAAQADAIITLLNEIRAVLVEKGLMKGAA